MNRRSLDLVGAATLGLCVLLLSPLHRAVTGANDFAHLYAGGRLFGTAELYSARANEAIERPLIGGVLKGSRFMRPPFECLFLKPLSLLPYRTAYAIFQAANVAALGLFLILMRSRWPDVGVACAMSAPVVAAFVNGQELPVLLMLAAVSLWLARGGRDFTAGVVLALCASKPQLFLLVPLAMAIHRRWRYIAGATASFLVLNAAAVAATGPGVVVDFLRMLGAPGASPWPEMMPSMRAIAGTNDPAFVILCALAAATCVAAMARVGSFEAAFAIALIGSLLISPHAYMQDGITVLLSAAILLPKLPAGALRTLLWIALIPVPYLLLLLGGQWSWIVPGLLTTILIATCCREWAEQADGQESRAPHPLAGGGTVGDQPA